jgi:RNA polymerase-binding transcription factor DksA
MTSVDTEHFRRTLLEERRRIVAAIEYLHEENPGSLEDETGELVSGSADNHMGDTATATFDREIDYTLEENSGNVLREIEAALRRIEDGTFGVCRTCGRPIEPERLEYLPWTTQCAADARRG